MDKKQVVKVVKVLALVLFAVSFFLPFIRLQLAAMNIDNAHNVFAEELNTDDPANLIGYIGLVVAVLGAVVLFVKTPVEKYGYLAAMAVGLIVLIVGQNLVFGSDSVVGFEALTGVASMGTGLVLGYVAVVVGLVTEVANLFVLKTE